MCKPKPKILILFERNTMHLYGSKQVDLCIIDRDKDPDASIPDEFRNIAKRPELYQH